jgi:hypothetical protein
LHNKYRDHFGVSDDDVLVVSGATSIFNPTLSVDEIARQRRIDPTAARSEWDGEFRDDLASYLDSTVVEAAIDYSRPLELPPRSGVFYRAYTDPAGGTGGDSYTVAICHREKDGQIVLDVCRGTQGRYDPYAVTQAYADLLKQYRCRSVKGDKYSASAAGARITFA